MTWLLQDGQIAAVNDPQTTLPTGDHQAAEMPVQFRRTAGQVEHLHFGAGGNESQQRVDRLGGHFLLALRAGIDVAMQATLIAAIAQIDLQGFHRAPAQGRESADCEKGEGGVHLVFLRLIVLPSSSASGVSLQRVRYQAGLSTLNAQRADDKPSRELAL
jgi:hypothetical protein